MTRMSLAMSVAALFICTSHLSSDACTRVVYAGTNGNVATGRTLDWRTPIPTSLRIMPRGERHESYDDPASNMTWTSKYGSVVSIGYDMGISEGLNEAGMAVNLLYLPGSVYTLPDSLEHRKKMSASVWAGYVLDNFGSVDDAIKEMSKDEFHIEAAAMPGGTPTTIHMAMSDSTGNSAVVEYVDGKLCIYKGREYNVLTNTPTFEKQLAIRDYWEGVGGMNMLPGTNRSTDRFDRASFYLSVLPKDLNHNEALAAVFGIVRNCAVPMGISVPGQPEISSTQWMSVCDHRDKVYYFQLILSPATVWVDLKKADLSKGAPQRSITLESDGSQVGDITAKFKVSAPFKPYFHQ